MAKKREQKKNRKQTNKTKGDQKQSHAESNAENQTSVSPPVVEPSSTDRKREMGETVGSPKKPPPSNAKRHRGEKAGQGDPQPGAKLADTQALVEKPGLPDNSVNKLGFDGHKPPAVVGTDLISSGALESSHKQERLPENSERESNNEDHKDLDLQPSHKKCLEEHDKNPNGEEGSVMEGEGLSLQDVRNKFEKRYLSTLARLKAVEGSVKQFDDLPRTRESIDLQREWINSLGYFPQEVMERYLTALESEKTFIDNSKNSEIDRIQGSGDDSKTDRIELSEYDSKILSDCGPKVLALLQKARKATAMERNARIVQKKARVLSDTITKYLRKFQDVYSVLYEWVGLGQEVETVLTEKEITFDDTNNSAVREYLKENGDPNADYGGTTIGLDKYISRDKVTAEHIAKFGCWRCDEIDEMIQNELTVLNKSDADKKSLQHICSVLHDWLDNSKVVNYREDKYKEKCEIGIRRMNARLRNKGFETDESKELETDENQEYCPSMFAIKVDGSHASIASVVDAITKLGRPGSPAEFSPRKKAKMRELDLCIEKPGLYHILMLDSAIKLPVVIKPLFRSKKGPDDLDEECLSQVLGHLAKYLIPCMNFHSVGTSSFATGVICTLAYIKVVQMYLVIEEDKVELRVEVSKRLPLISETTFQRWMTNDTKHKSKMVKKKRSLQNDLYRDNAGYSVDGIPKGMLVLRALVRLPRKFFFGPNFGDLYKLDDKDVTMNGDILGHGTFGVVLTVNRKGEGPNDSEELVLKAPAISFTKHIANEKEILKKLGQASKEKAKDFLSILESTMSIRVELGSAKISANALLLRPKGKPLSPVLKSFGTTNNELDGYTGETKVQIGEALTYMHGKGYVHNDVSPKNIIVVPNNTNKIKLCLVDFGAACVKGKQPSFFLGTRQFAHDMYFENYPNYPNELRISPKCDLFSLALTCCAISRGGDPTWDMGKIPNRNAQGLSKVLESRRAEGQKIIDEFCGREENSIHERDLKFWLCERANY